LLEELKASAKQTVAVPTDMSGLVIQLKIFRGVLMVFLGPNNPASQGIKSLLNDFEENSVEFDSLSVSDSSYPTKILYSVDTRVQRFMSQCKRMKDRDDVNERLVDFSDLTESCLNQGFNVSLPPAFQVLASKTPSDQGHLNLGDKRKRKDQEVSLGRLINPDQDADFKMKPTETWGNNWAGKLNYDKPFWDRSKCQPSDCKMCPKFHIRGYCFEDCSNAESHVPKSRIPADRKTAMKDYMKKVRRS
jgi:hypothetical protein